MKKFIAYFDYLGFKDFILKNGVDFQRRIMNNNFRDIELAISDGATIEGKYGFIPDRSKSTISCMNFSDTVVFWTKDDSIDSLLELLKVAYRYNWHSNLYTFPTRGAVTYGELEHVDFRDNNGSQALYNINSLYGRGLVDAHVKSESQHWAGAVIDQSVIRFLMEAGRQSEPILGAFAKKYLIPYNKLVENQQEEFALRLVEGELNEESFKIRSENIKRNFGEHNKGVDHPRVIEKLENTISYLKSFLVD